MPVLTSLNIPENADFFEVCRLTDHVQKKATSNFLTSEDIKKTLYIYENMKQYGETVFAVCFSAYSVKGFEFKSKCTKLTLTKTGGSVSRIEAPEEKFGQGSKYIIHLIKPVYGYSVPAEFYRSCNEENHVILRSTENT